MTKKATYQSLLDGLAAAMNRKEDLNLRLHNLRALSGEEFGKPQHEEVGKIVDELDQLKRDHSPRLRAIHDRETQEELPRLKQAQSLASGAVIAAREKAKELLISIGFEDTDPSLRGSIPPVAISGHPLVRNAVDAENDAMASVDRMENRIRLRKEEIARLVAELDRSKERAFAGV